MKSYRTLRNDAFYTGTIIEKKSRFIGELSFAGTPEDASAVLAAARKKYYDAKHHCSASIILGEDGAPDREHSSDDGEPSGTAGRPMLDVLRGSGLKNVVLVVTRYFGGTLLGTGGLVRAYTDAAKAALEQAEILRMRPMTRFEVTFAYPSEGTFRRFLSDRGIVQLEPEYTDKVLFRVDIPEETTEAFQADLINLLSGAVDIKKGDTSFMPGPDTD